jgi:hypothetical protein
VQRYKWAIAAAAFLAGLLIAGHASSEDRLFHVRVTVAEISDSEGGIDARAKRLNDKLRREKFFKFNSLSVIEERRLALKMDEVGSVKLPGGRMFRVRPLNLSDRGLLMAVGWEGEMMMDMRAPNHHLLVVGGPTHGAGQLVVSIEPEY